MRLILWMLTITSIALSIMTIDGLYPYEFFTWSAINIIIFYLLFECEKKVVKIVKVKEERVINGRPTPFSRLASYHDEVLRHG